MSNVFRLRYYLRRAGEKQPILLLEALTLPNESSTKPYFLHHSSGAVEPVELRKLQPLEKSSNDLRSLASELLRQGLGSNLGSLQRELQGLWRASVKKIAVRNLERGQLFAEAGASFIVGRSSYAVLRLLPSLAEQTLAPVVLRETTTGKRYGAMLKLIESFGDDFALYRLNLDRAEQEVFLCTEQFMSDESLLYELEFPQKVEQNIIEVENTQIEDAEAKSAKIADDQIENIPQNNSQWVFMFSSGVEKSSTLQHFLRAKFKVTAASKKTKKNSEERGERQVEEQVKTQAGLFAFLEDLAAEFRGWGSESQRGAALHPDEWVFFGAWSLKRELFDKYAKYVHQRACCFGGFSYSTLLRELSAELSQALVYSFLDYLCGSESGSSGRGAPHEIHDAAYASCRKVEDYILAKEAMHPEACLRKEILEKADSGKTSLQEISVEEPLEDGGSKEYFSPQGRKMLEELSTAGSEGLPKSRLQEEVMNCLLRSGWAVFAEESKRCYARGKEPVEVRAPAEGINTLLSHYKKKDKTRYKSSEREEWTLNDFAEKKHSRRDEYQGRDFQNRDSRARDSEGRGSYGRNSQGRDFQNRDSRARDSEGRGSYGRNSQGRDFQNRDSRARDSESRGSYGRSSQGRDFQNRDSRGRDSENRGSYGRSSQGRDFQNRDSRGRDSESRGSYGRNSQGRDFQNRDSRARDSESRGSYGRNTQGRDFQNRDSRARNSQGRNSESRNFQSRNRGKPR